LHLKSIAYGSDLAARKLDDIVYIVGLNLCLVRRLVSVYLAAFGAFMQNDVSLFWVCDSFYGAHDRAAFACSVAGIYVHVQGAEAFRAMVSGGVAEGLYLEAAVGADEAVIVFCKKLLFHIVYSFLNCERRVLPRRSFCFRWKIARKAVQFIF
jgi:hypothetical protein